MQLVNGLGGAFVFSSDPARLAGWYTEMLGVELEANPEGDTFWRVFWAANPQDTAKKYDTTFGIMRANDPQDRQPPEAEPDSMYGDQPYMLNFRTDDLEALLKHLEAKKVRILRREDTEYGWFAWVRDRDGNRVELYQPLPFQP